MTDRFRTVGVLLPPDMVVALDDFRPTQKSRSCTIAEAIQEYLANRGVEVEIPDGLYRPMIAITNAGHLGGFDPAQTTTEQRLEGKPGRQLDRAAAVGKRTPHPS